MGHFFGLFVRCLSSLCTFYFIYKIVSVQYIVQIYAEQHTGASVLLLDEETIIFIKIQNTNTLDVKICPQSCLLFVFGQVMKAIAVHFVHE